MRPQRLDAHAITAHLATVPAWELAGSTLRRQFELADFKAALAFVNRVGALAEAADHHPDILIEYGKVTLTLSTHDAGGLTELDFQLAARIDTAAAP